MKTINELGNWQQAIAAAEGDPSARVAQVFLRYAPAPDGSNDLLAVWDAPFLGLYLLPPQPVIVEIHDEGPQVDEEMGELTAFGLDQICAGCWTLRPSLNMPGYIHAFICIYGVPHPAPWERMIITPAEFAAQAGRRF